MISQASRRQFTKIFSWSSVWRACCIRPNCDVDRDLARAELISIQCQSVTQHSVSKCSRAHSDSGHNVHWPMAWRGSFEVTKHGLWFCKHDGRKSRGRVGSRGFGGFPRGLLWRRKWYCNFSLGFAIAIWASSTRHSQRLRLNNSSVVIM